MPETAKIQTRDGHLNLHAVERSRIELTEILDLSETLSGQTNKPNKEARHGD
jgi:hypothetical protein